jgi:DNA-directed RNA polymerase II subunit RPB2
MWEIIDKYHEDHPNQSVQHHIDTYHDLVETRIPYIIKAMASQFVIRKHDIKFENKIKHEITIKIGGDNHDKIFFDKTAIIDGKNTRPVFPSEAQLRNITYMSGIYADIKVEVKTYDTESDKRKQTGKERSKEYDLDTREFFKVKIGQLPIMVRSKLCASYNLKPNVLKEIGECPFDFGGYFIIDGLEKIVVSQERMVTNKIFVNKSKDVEKKFSYEARVRCTADDNDLFPMKVQFQVIANQFLEGSRGNAITVSTRDINTKPTSKTPDDKFAFQMPLCILFRALGIESDKEIAEHVIYDVNDPHSVQILDFLRPSFKDGSFIYTQEEAFAYLSPYVKYHDPDQKTPNPHHLKYVLMDRFLPNVGKSFKQKALMLGYYVNQLIKTCMGVKQESSRDNYMYKRVDVSGYMMTALFRDAFNKFRTNIILQLDMEYMKSTYNDPKTFDKETGKQNMDLLINKETNLTRIFNQNTITQHFITSFKGNWGLLDDPLKMGYVQPLNRLSTVGSLSHERRVRTPIDPEVKMVEPHKLYGSQWGILCSTESPDGLNVGLLKHMAVLTKFTKECDIDQIKECLMDHGVIQMGNLNPNNILNKTKVFVNNIWFGIHDNPPVLFDKLKLLRRTGIINSYVGLSWNILDHEINVRTDVGRCVRPLLIVHHSESKNKRDKDKDKNNMGSKYHQELLIKSDDYHYKSNIRKMSWNDYLLGTLYASKHHYPEESRYDKHKLEDIGYDPIKANSRGDKELERHIAPLEYIDIEESDSSLVAMSEEHLSDPNDLRRFTHCEIHPSTSLSIYTNTIPLCPHNPSARNALSGAQGKQAIGVFATNFNNRIDKATYILHYPQKPLLTTRYMAYNNMDTLPNGANVIMAVSTYTGLNMEDAIIFNESAVKRGLFNISSFKSVEAEEEDEPRMNERTIFGNPKEFQTKENIQIKKGIYTSITKDGIPKMNSYIGDKNVLLGKINISEKSQVKDTLVGEINQTRSAYKYLDKSILGSRFEYGHVDKAYLYNKNNTKHIKIRLRQFIYPAVGDKFASKHAQKGVIGAILPARDLPFTKNGIIPDIVINPHAFPSRMTIGHILECVLSKFAVKTGRRIDGTAFDSQNLRNIDEMMTDVGLEKHGEEVMYNGRSGEQMKANIFMGPVYYQRLKHMVKDKINARGGSSIKMGGDPSIGGKVSNFTRQAPHGRANDGGLKMGEMELNAVIAHGTMGFLKESIIDRCDKYSMTINDDDGMIAKANPMTNTYKGTRNVSEIELPFVYKQMVHELTGLGLYPRFVTEKTEKFDPMNPLNPQPIIEHDDEPEYDNNVLEILNGESEPEND